MKKKMKQKQVMPLTEIQRKELQEWWLSVKYMLTTVATFLIVDAIAARDLRNSAPLPGWMWALGVLGMARWLYGQTAHILLLDIKGDVMATLYPFLLRQRPARIKLTSMMKAFLFYIPILAAVHTMGRGYHTGFTFFASAYLGLGLFAFLVTTGRRRVWIRWLQKITESAAVQQIKAINAVEEIDAPGWYVLAKYPAWAIRIVEDEGSYVADVQVETIAGWRPVCNHKGRPRRLGRIHQLVRELKKAGTEWDSEADETLARVGVSV